MAMQQSFLHLLSFSSSDQPHQIFSEPKPFQTKFNKIPHKSLSRNFASGVRKKKKLQE